MTDHLRLTLAQIKNDIIKQAKDNLHELKPKIQESEDYLRQVELLHEKIEDFKHELEEQVTSGYNAVKKLTW